MLWPLTLILITSFLAGMALGAFYFWTLWRSVRILAERQAHSILLGYLFRLSIILGGFFLIMGGHWERLVSALAGFLVIRAILVRRWGDRRVENLSTGSA